MKVLVAFLSLFVFLNATFAQTVHKEIRQIRKHFKWINQQKNFEIVELNNEDYVNNVPDNGAQLKGYFLGDSLYKVVDWIGTSSAIMTAEYYLWNGKLIFVYYVEKQYQPLKDAQGEIIGLNYNAAQVNYQSLHYFADGKQIKKIEKGNAVLNLNSPEDFLKNIREFETLLRQKKSELSGGYLEKLQGKWVSTEDSLDLIEFKGNVKAEYYEGELMDTAKISTDHSYLICQSEEDEHTDKYQIVELTDTTLKLLYLPAGRILTYTRCAD